MLARMVSENRNASSNTTPSSRRSSTRRSDGSGDAAEAQLALLRVVEAGQQQRRPSTCPSPAARPARASPPARPARPNPSSTGSRRRVAERDAVELDAERARGQRRGSLADRRRRAASRPGRTPARRPPWPAGRPRPARRSIRAGPTSCGHVGGEREERAERDRAVERQPAAEADHRHLAEGREAEQRRVEPRGHPGRPQPLAEQPPRALLAAWRPPAPPARSPSPPGRR